MGDTPNSKRVIFDVGAHMGEDLSFYLALGYDVVAIEANPSLVTGLEERFADDIAEGRLTIMPVAVGARQGSVTFYLNSEHSVWGTADPMWAERNRKMGTESVEIEVPSMDVLDIIADHGCPEYIKIDIEGADLACLKALSTGPCRPKYVSIESCKTSWRDLMTEFEVLESQGYRRFKVVRQGRHHRYNGEFRAVDGSMVDYHFDKDSSGPFGPYLRGRWLTKEQAVRRYRIIFAGYLTLGDTTLAHKAMQRVPVVRRGLDIVGWYDTHASL